MYPQVLPGFVTRAMAVLFVFALGMETASAQPPTTVDHSNAPGATGISNRPEMVHVHATPGTYDGPCPGTITFTAKVFGDPGDTVIVQWNRSDGGVAPPDTIVLDKSGKATTTTTWTLGGPSLPEYEGWQSATATYPDGTEVTSERAEFRVKCGEDDDDSKADVEVGVSPEEYEGPCPGVFTFTATISGNAGDTLTGMWERSDSATAPSFEIVLDSTGSATATTTWTLGGTSVPEYEGWERLKLTLPDGTVVTSEEAEFKLKCEDSTDSDTTDHADDRPPHIAIRVVPGAHVGPCPAVFTFTAKIFGAPGDTVSYKWNRSDGAIGPVETVVLDEDGQAEVTTTWTLSVDGYEGWESLTVTYPDGTELTSRQAGFKLKCKDRGNSSRAESQRPSIE